MVDVERFARTDTSVTPQALKLTAANPDAILVVASGSGAAMPQLALAERGYKGKIYQTHAAATPDLMRIGGKTVEGTFVVSGPALLGDQLPDSHPSKKQAINFVTNFEKAFGAELTQPVCRPCLRLPDCHGKSDSDGAEERQAWHARVPHGHP